MFPIRNMRLGQNKAIFHVLAAGWHSALFAIANVIRGLFIVLP